MRIVSLAMLLLVIMGCQPAANSAKGFSLPEGDASAGKAAFMQYGCVDCHVVEGITSKPADSYALLRPVRLGGPDAGIRTYGQLVTSVINPSHKLAPRYPVSMITDSEGSKMPNINDSLTVTDLINLVAFLQPKYDVEPYPKSKYRTYELRVPEKDTAQKN
ncbi:cytochrome C [Alteromonas gilva]|uniref:Cytochrome C n=1 Tax=Alteromonas gilva TaxID=2987522 RepID=A0ABT5KXL9_9ALTE|nr:cytochrome C [Alteromonas gilva]MDC8829512.1 cytochrome C [Alteromonas gilva]